MHEGRQRSNVIGQFLARVAQGLDFELRRWIKNREPTDLAVRVPERHRRLVGPGRLGDRRHAPESNLPACGRLWPCWSFTF